MKMALKDTPDTPFRIPPGIKLISVDVHSGMRGTGPGTIMEAFKPGTGPPDTYGGGGGWANRKPPRAANGQSDREQAGSIEGLRSSRYDLDALVVAPLTLGWIMRAEAEQLVEFDQAVRGTAEEASLTSMGHSVVSAN